MLGGMSYVAVSASALAALERALSDLADARRSLERTAAQLAELGQDFCDDAVARLRERGASPPQLESYEHGWQFRRDSMAERVAAIHDAER
jgi:hypothetical protein